MAPTPGKKSKQTVPAPRLEAATDAREFNQQLMAAGLITRLPDASLDIDDDDPDDQPVPIKGEPLSETIIRERDAEVAAAYRRNRMLVSPR